MASSARPTVQNRGAAPVVGVRVVIEGVVQGVGFRPFVWRTATELGLAGRVRNVAGTVEVEATGSPEAIAAFTARLATEAPPRARVGRVHSSPLRADLRAAAFTIDTSASGPADRGDPAPSGVVERLFPPDLATCDACLAEVRDPADRRHRYPFTNCTDCGPRATIIDDLPYDRAATTMHAFAMCPDCAGEYRDPADRRFHAEPVACAACGRDQLLRRGRGYAPGSIALPVAAERPVLAVGAELKHTFTLARGVHAHVAPHNGDLQDLGSHTAFTDGLAHLSRLLAVVPEVVAHDLHPEYLSTKYAVAHFDPAHRVPVQHHHAHVVSCAAEHGITGPFLGVAYDGLGMGDDGTLWGGEVLVADLTGYRRFARFGRAPLPGGALAVRRPYRMALGYLLGAERLGVRDNASHA